MPTISLTDKNLELLKAVVEVMKAEINWEEVAKKANMSGSKYARDQWTVVRNKLIAGEGNGKAAAGTKRKDSATSTPAPTAKRTKTARGKKAAARAASEDADDEETKVKDEEGEDFGLDDELV